MSYIYQQLQDYIAKGIRSLTQHSFLPFSCCYIRWPSLESLSKVVVMPSVMTNLGTLHWDIAITRLYIVNVQAHTIPCYTRSVHANYLLLSPF